jgi:HK97 family phage major capsid protein
MSRTASPTPTTEVDDITIPDTPAALEEFMTNRKNMLAVLQQDGKFDELVRRYAGIVMKKNLDIQAQVDEQVTSTLGKWLKEHREDGYGPASPINLDFSNGRSGLAGPDPRTKAGLYNPQAMGASLDKEFPGPLGHAEFFNLVWRHHKRALDSEGHGKINRIRNAFQSDVPSDGGFLIPENLRAEVLRIALETGIVRQRARVVPMETLRVPFPMIDTTTDVGSVFGGITCYWTEESATLQSTSPAFGRIVLDAKKLTAYAVIPQELIADSIISFQPFISEVFPEALGFYEDIAFINGSGVGEPVGCLNTSNPAIIAVAKEAQPAATIVWENIVKMYARMLPSSLGRAVWVASIDTFPELATMALSVGTGGSAIWLNNGQVGPPMSILGRPVVFTEKAPGVLGAQGDISFVDFGYYLIGDRQVMSSSVSEHFRFGTDELAFKIIERVDGRPWMQSPITPQNGGATLSPFVQLAVR